MNFISSGSPRWRQVVAGITVLTGICAATAQLSAQPRPTTVAATAPSVGNLKGRTVESVRVVGNTQVSTPVILNVIRTREGDPYDPNTVEEDYQRVYALRKFSNVEAKVEPTETGVIVAFVVSEQKQIRDVIFRGNLGVDTLTVQGAVDLQVGESIDRFRIAMAKRSIETLYREKNYPFAHVEIAPEPLAETGDVVFNIIEGPNVRVRKVDMVGNTSFSDDRLKDEIRTKYWIWIFRHGTFDPDMVDDDVAALRRFYEQKGFFDVRVGRKLIWSPDQTELQVNFVIEEGPRYIVERVSFKGNTKVSEADLRKDMKLVEGLPYDGSISQRDVRQMVKAYSPFGFIYQPQSNNPEYLRIQATPVFGTQPGKVELVYEISEGKPFTLGRILVKGNYKSQDKLVLREMRVAPGQLYNSGEIQDAAERLHGQPYFSNVQMTPIGDDPNSRDLLVDVQEAKTASFNVGAGVNSNGGVGGNVTYEQRNFDILNWPNSWGEMFTDRAFTGAGQDFRISLEPGTVATNASIRFSEPWLFDQPYSFTTEFYLRDRVREHYDDTRYGGRVSFGKRFNFTWSALLTLRGEDVQIHNVEDEPIRAPEIVEAKGHNTLTSIGLQLRRDTANHGFLPSRGSTATAGWESGGALGGDYSFQKFTLSWDSFYTLDEDLLDRKTVLTLHADSGYIWGGAPFFERFYGGGIGSIRGFRFRGVSPRAGLDDDQIGGDFFASYTAEVNFPIAGETLRGVVFTDGGTVERDFELNTLRTSVGAGIRLVLPILGQAPLALDFAYPITKDELDDTQWVSFSFGVSQ